MLDLLGEPHPAFELALPLARPIAGRRRPARPSSTATSASATSSSTSDGLAAVLDWELAHIGDPMEDLGWLCVKAWRFGWPRPVAGLGEYEELFDAYGEASGRPVDPDGRPLVGGAGHAEVGDHVHHAGQRPPHRRRPAATSWRRSAGGCARTSTTCSLLLDGSRSMSGPARRADRRASSSRPSGSGWSATSLPEADGRLRFHARVAVNVLAIVERELGVGGRPGGRPRRAAGRSWAWATTPSWPRQIRSGELDDRLDEVQAVVLGHGAGQAGRRQPPLPRTAP